MVLSKQKSFFYDNNGKFLSPVFIIMFAFVYLFLAIALSLFYSSEVNVNYLESSILLDRISSCLINDGIIIDSIINNPSNSFVDFDLTQIFINCNLDASAIGYSFSSPAISNTANFLVNIKISSLSSQEDNKFPKILRFGNNDLLTLCLSSDNKELIKDGKIGCSQESFYVLDNNGNDYLFEIMVSSKNIGRITEVK